MIQEYPEYYTSFKCIADKCPDSCCIDWEVDIDDETYYYYMTVKGAFGERLRASIKEEGLDRFFPLNERKRCPFLNSSNLCDIITSIGEESLCRVCTEYPRYYEVVGDYEQIDISLSCMEAGRLFFAEDGFRTVRSGSGFGDELTDQQRARLEKILSLRERTIDYINIYETDEYLDHEGLLKLTSGVAAFMFREYRLKNNKVLSSITEESEELLKEKMAHLELLDDRWTFYINRVNDIKCEELSERKVPSGYIKKLLIYFVFRYTIETYYDKSLAMEARLIIRCVRYIWLMCISGEYDIVDLCHIFSRQVEHSEENVEYLKRP